MTKYQADNNNDSLDGLPGLRFARKENGHWLVVGDTKARLKRVGVQWEGLVAGMLIGMVLMWVMQVGYERFGSSEGWRF